MHWRRLTARGRASAVPAPGVLVAAVLAMAVLAAGGSQAAAAVAGRHTVDRPLNARQALTARQTITARQPSGRAWPAARGQPITGAAPQLGSVTISAPVSAMLGTVTEGTGSISGSLGSVVVTCSTLVLGAWTATVTATAFSDGAMPTPHTIPDSAISYTAGTASISGSITLSAPGSGNLAGSLTAQSATVIAIGTSTATWNPTISVAIPLAAPAGSYSATITHSAA